jgi:hypothetical protein
MIKSREAFFLDLIRGFGFFLRKELHLFHLINDDHMLELNTSLVWQQFVQLSQLVFKQLNACLKLHFEVGSR